MSGPGQYPGNYNNNPLSGQFNQQQQQMVNSMGANAAQGGGNMMPMYPQGGGMMGQQQQQVLGGSGGMSGPGGVGVMNPTVGMQSPSHVQQQQQQLMQSQQMHMQQQQQQMGMGGGVAGPVMNAGSVGGGVMQQQQALQAGGSMQQQQSGPHSQAASNMLAMPQPIPHKEINIVALSRLGQETVQDITSRFQEIFAALKVIQPTANRDNNTEKKVQEYFRTIRLLFKRVRIIYEKCNDGYPQGMEYTNVESLVPYRDEPDHRLEPTQCEEYRKAVQENQELIETVKLKNRQLREIIDRTRIIIWEINTMLSMRRS